MSERVEDGMLLAYNRLRMQFDVLGVERDRLLAENQRYEKALQLLANPKWHPKSEEAALLIAEVEGIAREALAGDTE